MVRWMGFVSFLHRIQILMLSVTFHKTSKFWISNLIYPSLFVGCIPLHVENQQFVAINIIYTKSFEFFLQVPEVYSTVILSVIFNLIKRHLMDQNLCIFHISWNNSSLGKENENITCKENQWNQFIQRKWNESFLCIIQTEQQWIPFDGMVIGKIKKIKGKCSVNSNNTFWCEKFFFLKCSLNFQITCKLQSTVSERI